MHSQSLRATLSQLFAAHGFSVTEDAALEGRSGTLYNASMLVEQGDYAVLIEPRTVEESVSPTDVAGLAKAVRDIGAEHGLFVHLGPAAAAPPLEISMWDANQLSRLIGNWQLSKNCGVALERLPLDGPTASTSVAEPGFQVDDPAEFQFPDAFSDAGSFFDEMETPLAATPANPLAFTPQPPDHASDDGLFSGIDFDGLEGLGSQPEPTAVSPVDMFSNPPAANQPMAPIAPTPTWQTAYPVLPAVFGAEQAAASVKDRLYLVEKAELILQPVHIIDYECDRLIEGSLKYDTVGGRTQVHGTRKEVRQIEGNLDTSTAGAPPPHRGELTERTLRVTHERALQLVRDAVTDEHTRTVQIESNDEDGDVSYTERKQVAPRPDQIRLNHIAIVNRPQWRLSGPNGSLVVDAVSGEATAEELRSGNPDMIILD